MNNQTDIINVNTIPNIAMKIKELSYVKQTYLKFIIQLFPLTKNLLLKDYSNQIIRLLQNLINIHKNEILIELEDALTNVLVAYIFDLHDLIKGQLNIEKYEIMHANLITINKQINHHMVYNDRYELGILKEQLYLI